MSKPPRPFTVERVKRRGPPADAPAYQSAAGDPRRSGKAALPPAPRDDPRRTATEAAIEFRMQPDGSAFAIIGKGALHVATIRPENHPNAKASFWFDLPWLPRTPRYCASMPVAEAVVRRKVAEWFDATDHVLSAAAQLRLRHAGKL